MEHFKNMKVKFMNNEMLHFLRTDGVVYWKLLTSSFNGVIISMDLKRYQ